MDSPAGRGRAGQRGVLNLLVRPYVLGTGSDPAGSRPRPGDQGGTGIAGRPDGGRDGPVAAPGPADGPGHYRLFGHWAGGQAPHQLLDETGASGWHEPGQGGPPGPGQPGPGGADRPHRLGRAACLALARNRWTLAIGTVGLLGLASTLLLVWPRPAPRVVASGCAAAPCRPATPQPQPSASTLAATTTASRSPAASASTPPAAPSRSPAPAPAGPQVTVSYTLVQHWDSGFQGEFTIVNNGRAAINGWQLSAVLPGDTIDTVWDASYHTSGDTLVMDPASTQVTIPAGTSLNENFTANGTTTSPAGCTFNGIAGC
jgi:Cellulose binding domain